MKVWGSGRVLAGLGVLAIGLLAGTTGAEAGQKKQDWKFELGAGAAMIPEYPGSDTFSVRPMPIVDINWKDTVFLTGGRTLGLGVDEGLGWNVYKTKNFRVGPLATYYWGSSDRPTGINDVDPGFQVGAFTEFAFDHWKLDAKALYGVSGSSEGARLNLGVSWGSKFAKDWTLIVRGDTHIANANEMKTYWGISPREASDNTKGYSEHDPGVGVEDVGLGFNLRYAVTDEVSIVSVGRFGYLVMDAADSPLSEADYQGYLGLGVSYSFGM